MISIIICTYNRPHKVRELLSLLFLQTQLPREIIVVDSSEIENKELKNRSKVIYLRSSHKNQPYQRYLGFLKSTSDYLLFLDDDMEPASSEIVSVLTSQINIMPDFVGIAINFKDKYKESSLSHIPNTIFPKGGYISFFLRSLTGYIKLSDGKVGYCGLRGSQPRDGGYTEWVSGGAFLAKRSELYLNFNFQLFNLFDQKMGMGEDVILGYTLSKRGKIYFLPQLLFWHNDLNDSSYSLNHKSFSQRVIFSRLYLTLEVARLRKKSKLFSRIFFYWFTLWRLFGLISNYFLSRDNKIIKENILKGAFNGLVKSFSFKFDQDNSCKDYWINETTKDLIINESNFSNK
jgi:glycosyltransferase involved in cell wall biosynthesis